MATLHVPSALAERRRSPRRIGELPGALLSRWGKCEILICDLSHHGFRAETDLDLPIGAEVRLVLAGPEPVLARIVWREGAFLGGEFVKPISAVAVADAFSGRDVIESPSAMPRFLP